MSKEKKYYNSLNHINDNISSNNEFDENLPIDAMFENADKLSASSTSRRDFLKFLGFGTLAATLASCEAPVVKSIPYLNKPENIIPGIPLNYASAYFSENTFASLLVKTREGRPILLSSNHKPDFGGGINARCQASVLSLYDQNRLKNPLKKLKETNWSVIDGEILQKINNAKKKIILVSSTVISPSFKSILREFKKINKNFSHVVYDAFSKDAILSANYETFGKRFIPTYRFDKAECIVSFSADFLNEWLDPAHARQYTKNRKPENGKMSRHYHFEGLLSVTGANADKRVPVKPSQQSHYISRLHDILCETTGGKKFNSKKTNHETLLYSIAEDLLKNKGKSLIVCGSDNKSLQIIVNKINMMLNNYGKTIFTGLQSNLFSSNDNDITDLIEDMKNGRVDIVMFLDTNPAYTLPGSLEFTNAIKNVSTKISFSESLDETAKLCDYVCPNSNYLESWGDLQPYSGTYYLQQPTITPIFNSRQAQESFLIWSKSSMTYLDFLKSFFKTISTKSWNKVLHDGYVNLNFDNSEIPYLSKNLNIALDDLFEKSGGIELELYVKGSLGQGLYSNNPWLQELPDVISKVTWDNYLTISPTHAKELGVANWHVSNGALDGHMVNLVAGGKSMKCPVYIQPGQAHGVLGLAFGYGRTETGKAGKNIGVNAYEFYQGFDKLSTTDVSIEVVSGKHEFACTQNSHTMMGRNIVKETNLSEYLVDNKSGNKQFLLHSHKGHVKPNDLTLWKEHERDVHFWNMSIDLNSCTGCGACVIACHAENNVPVVGKEEVRKNRDMHWLRIDRYYSSDMTKERAKKEGVGSIEMYKKMEEPSDSENLEVVFQPVMCQHCNHAPCETVCPVAATTHSREGLNHMTYNRCIGTRYCMNNCPYKVRRFNWFNYSNNDQFDFNMNDDLGKMVLNPDVTVRSRGVMEKCTMCIQNIQKTKLDAKKERRKIKDGEIACACEKACDTGAIVFGDALDKNSRIVKEKKNPRSYYLIEELNTQPSVFYKTKVRNKKV